MGTSTKKPAPQSVWTWILITLLWGTVFFATSTWALSKTSLWFDGGSFRLDRGEMFSVYLMYVPVLLVIALLSMAVKHRLDPGSLRQIERQNEVQQGRRERYFVSFAGSVATSFLFTVLTACAHIAAAPVTGAVVRFGVWSVLAAAMLNLAAGLAASLLVGVIFIVSGMTKASGRR